MERNGGDARYLILSPGERADVCGEQRRAVGCWRRLAGEECLAGLRGIQSVMKGTNQKES